MAAAAEGDLETFGDALTSIGISILNPNRFLHNCVSVSIAKILSFRDVHEFWQATLHSDLPDSPLTFPQIKDLISRTGWEFTWKVYKTRDGESAYYNMHRESPIPGPASGPGRVVAYTRANGVGHCVGHSIVDCFDPPVRQRPCDRAPSAFAFTCYQHNKYGIDVLPEIKVAQKLIVFFLRCPRNTPQHDSWVCRRFLRMIERRRDPVWLENRLQVIKRAMKAFGLELSLAEEESLSHPFPVGHFPTVVEGLDPREPCAPPQPHAFYLY